MNGQTPPFTTMVNIYPQNLLLASNTSNYRSRNCFDLAREFEKTGYLYAKTGQDFDEKGEIEQALQHYVHAIEYFLAAARFEKEPLRGVLRKQISFAVERSEKLKQKEKGKTLLPRDSIVIDSVDSELSIWEMVEHEDEESSTFSFDAVIVESTHPRFPLVRAILSGIQYSLRDFSTLCNGVLYDIPVHEYYMVKEYPLNIENKSFIFVDYAPTIFAQIRNLCGGSSVMMRSIFSSQTLQTIKTLGKSSSFFYFSQDKKYIMKSVPIREAEFLKSILIPYFTHLINNPHSLLVKFLGFFSIQCPDEQVIYFVVMENIINPNFSIQEVYDLKGSTHGRFVKENEKKKPNVVWKDIPLGHLKINETDKQLLAQQITVDTAFLESHQIMDYSLLVAIHHLPGFEYPSSKVKINGNYFKKDSGGIYSKETNCLYFIGIVDILTLYSWRKFLESTWKSIFKDERTISAVNPKLYRSRFEYFILDFCFA